MNKVLRLCMLFVFAATAGSSWAQERSISGKVTSIDDGSTLPGVNVVIKGTATGTITDFDGNYTLNVTDGSTLIFSFIGFANEEVQVGVRSTIDIQLSADVTQLTEIVVVAYGETTRKQLTGSVGIVDADMIENQQVVSIGRALQGTTPGVSIITGSGQPGSNPTIRIRGINSINSNAEPLIVLDGAVYNGNLSSINPNDVASMSVLKDAGSAALYGSRGSNGVIMITTKSGEVGKAKIDVSMSYGVSKRAIDGYDVVNTNDYAKLTWEAIRNQEIDNGNANAGQAASDRLISTLGYNPYGPSYPNPVNANGEIESGASLLWDTDWESAIARESSSRKDFNLGISGGSDKMKYRFSTSYLTQEGYVITSKFDRISTRLNLDGQVNDWLSMGMKTSFTYSDQNFPTQAGSSFKAPVQFSRNVPGFYPLYQRDTNGDYILDAAGNRIYDYGKNDAGGVNTVRPQYNGYNPAGTVLFDEFQRERYLMTLNGYLQADFLQNFSVRTNVAVDYYLFDTFDYENFEVGDQAGIGTVDRTKDITTSLTWWNQLAYQNSFGEHNVSAKLITEVNNYKFESMDARKAQFPFAGLKEFNGAANTTRLNGFTTPSRLFSVLGTADYSFRNKYFFNASFRQDASSRFGKDERSAPFLAAGFGWQLSDEDFMTSVGFVNSLKLRASYGELGNNDIFKANTTTSESDYFPYLQAFEAGHDDGTGAGVFVTRLADPLIAWEKSKMWNIGLDFSVLNSRLSGTVETYQKNTFDLIMDKPFPTSKGFGGVIVTNVGDIKNTGVELSLSSVNVKTSDFEWRTDFNISFEKNEILKLPDGQDGITNGSKRLVVGKDIYQYFIREWAGVDPSDGAPMWYRDVLDGDGNPTGERTVTKDFSVADKYFSGSALPDARGGFSTAVTYKGFTLSALANFSVGGKILDEDYSSFMHGVNSPGIQLHADNLDRWQQPGDVTGVPRLDLDGNGDVRSTRFLVDNSYLRLRNVTLAYNVTGDLLDKLKVFRSLSVNLKADNLLTISNAKQGLDPEQALNGLTNYRSSIFKTYSFGINIGL